MRQDLASSSCTQGTPAGLPAGTLRADMPATLSTQQAKKAKHWL
jgi:hypothetical protein